MSIATQTNATTLTFSQDQQLGDGNSAGTVMTPSATSLEADYGGTPVAQPTMGPANTFAGNADNSATLSKYQITNATTNPGASTTGEVTSLCTGLATTDVIAVNKPAAQAGLGVAGYRVSAANQLGINYTNISSGAITTSAEAYDVLAISSNFTTTAALTPAAVQATPGGAGNEQVFSVPGATVGSLAVVNKPTAQAGLGVSNVRVTAPGKVAITYINNSSGAITPTAETYSFAFLPTMVPKDARLIYNVALATSSIASSAATEVSSTVTGLLASDVIAGVSKPTAQSGLGIVGYRVSAANQVSVTYVNVSSGAITNTLEANAISVVRKQPQSPFKVTTATLTPVSVAALTTAEQTFTVNFLAQASTSVFVNKPSYTPGIHVVGARVSAASTLALTFQNNNTTAVVPPAESYTIGYLQLQGPGAVGTTGATTNSISVAVGAQESAVMDLRAALLARSMLGAI